MNAPAVACARRYSLRLASKAAADNHSVISVPSCTGVSTRRTARECGGRTSAAVAVTKARRSARLAKLPRISYAGMDGDKE